MEFKNYCIVVMGNTEGILLEINKISEKILGSMDGKGIFIVTFVANTEVNELNDYFKECKRNFLLFVLDKKSSGYNFFHQDIQNELFSKLEPNELEQMTKKLHNELKNNKLDKNVIKKNKRQLLTDKEIENLSNDERDKKISEIIDKGVANLDNYDKDILDKLTKSK